MTQTRPGLTFGAALLVTACCALFFASQQPSAVAQDKTKKAGPSVDNQKPADPADQLVANVRKKIIGYESVKADMIESVAIGGSRFRAIGKYLQGTDDRVRLEYQLEVAKPKPQPNANSDKSPKSATAAMGLNSMLQVSDGAVMYTLLKIGDDIRATRINVKEVQRSVADVPSAAGTDWLKDLGLGGVKAMLASFEKTMDFSDQVTEKSNGEEFVRVSGTWKAKERQKMVGDLPAETPLPGFIPDSVHLYFPKNNAFLRRVVYLKRHPTEKSKSRPMVTLDFINVEINAPVDAREFEPKTLPGVTAVDETDLFIKRLKGNATEASGAKPAAAQAAPGNGKESK